MKHFYVLMSFVFCTLLSFLAATTANSATIYVDKPLPIPQSRPCLIQMGRIVVNAILVQSISVETGVYVSDPNSSWKTKMSNYIHFFTVNGVSTVWSDTPDQVIADFLKRTEQCK